MEKKASPRDRSVVAGTEQGLPDVVSSPRLEGLAGGLRREAVEVSVEVICNKGCQAVRNDLAALERGETPAELERLGPGERREVYLELKAIMAVYGDVCRLS